MPLVWAKEKYGVGDLVLTLKSGTPFRHGSNIYGLDPSEHVLILEVGEIQKTAENLIKREFTTLKPYGQSCFHPKFYKGIEFLVPSMLYPHIVMVPSIMGVVCGTLQVEDPYVVQQFLNQFIKDRRSYLGSRYSAAEVYKKAFDNLMRKIRREG